MLALDAQEGALTAPASGNDVLTITDQRAIKVASSGGVQITALVPLTELTAIEVLDVARPTERLIQGALLLVLGAALGWGSWLILNTSLISLILGGLPILASVYALAGWAFPDTDGQLRLYAPGYLLSHPLRSPNARRDARLAAHLLYELLATAKEIAPDSTPLNEIAQATQFPLNKQSANSFRSPSPLENAILSDLGKLGARTRPVKPETSAQESTNGAEEPPSSQSYAADEPTSSEESEPRSHPGSETREVDKPTTREV